MRNERETGWTFPILLFEKTQGTTQMSVCHAFPFDHHEIVGISVPAALETLQGCLGVGDAWSSPFFWLPNSCFGWISLVFFGPTISSFWAYSFWWPWGCTTWISQENFQLGIWLPGSDQLLYLQICHGTDAVLHCLKVTPSQGPSMEGDLI